MSSRSQWLSQQHTLTRAQGRQCSFKLAVTPCLFTLHPDQQSLTRLFQLTLQPLQQRL
jgi:hypothetical protein